MLDDEDVDDDEGILLFLIYTGTYHIVRLCKVRINIESKGRQ